jgi:signal transduction histidine kinase
MSSQLLPCRDLPVEDNSRKSPSRFTPAVYPTPPIHTSPGANLNQRPVNPRKADFMPWRVQESGHEQNLLIERTEKMNLLFSVARHDISNQLFALQLCLDILQQAHPDDLQRDYYRRFSEGFDRISSILRFTRDYLDVGMQAPIWHDLGSVVNTAAGPYSGSHITIIIDVPPIEICADPMIERVFYNLIDNAVRHGGTISRLTITVGRQDSGLVITCEDDGIGIPVEHKERIFRKGYGKNTGLGLFFAREILRSSGITIRENGSPGTGARFEIYVPAGKYRDSRP